MIRIKSDFPFVSSAFKLTMKIRLLLLVLTFTVVANAQEPTPTPKLNLMPVPASIKFQPERLAVDANFRVATRGHSDARLEAGIFRFIRRLEGRTVLTLAPGPAAGDQTPALTINFGGPRTK